MIDPMMALDVMQFEFKRSLTKGRILIWVALVVFPVAIFTALSFLMTNAPIEAWGSILYFLVPEVVIMLGLLLWATPSISTEIEGQTWIYLALRSSGRTTVLIGKYLTAVLWSFSGAVLSISLCMMIVPAIGGFRLWLALVVLSFLSCVAHAAIFVLIGVFLHRRAMSYAVVYTLGIEYGLSFVPALANKLTVNYRTRGLLVEWMNWKDVNLNAFDSMIPEPAWVHLLSLFVFTLIALALALFRLTTAEYPTQQDG